MLSSIKMEVLRSLSRKPMRLDELACDIWIRLEKSPNPNPFEAPDEIRIRATLKRLLKDGSVVKIRRGVYDLSEDSRYELFRGEMIERCINEPHDSTSEVTSVGFHDGRFIVEKL